MAKPNVSPPGHATSRLDPATTMHYCSLRPATVMHCYSYRTLTPPTECHRNPIVWINPTKISCRGNVSLGIEKLI